MDEGAAWWGPESVERSSKPRPCWRADLCVSESRDDAILDGAFICIPVARRTFFLASLHPLLSRHHVRWCISICWCELGRAKTVTGELISLEYAEYDAQHVDPLGTLDI